MWQPGLLGQTDQMAHSCLIYLTWKKALMRWNTRRSAPDTRTQTRTPSTYLMCATNQDTPAFIHLDDRNKLSLTIRHLSTGSQCTLRSADPTWSVEPWLEVSLDSPTVRMSYSQLPGTSVMLLEPATTVSRRWTQQGAYPPDHTTANRTQAVGRFQIFTL